ncbi:MAG: hypothetical protein IJT50_06275 [Lentisphaeria bacterium]|nr:hypothetical protein [Lentisphaeria bacterium]
MKNSPLFAAMVRTALILPLLVSIGCATKTTYISDDGRLENGRAAQNVAGFSEKDIQICVKKAVDTILGMQPNRLVPPQGSARAVVVMKSTVDTISRGRDAAALSEALQIEFAQQLTDSGKIIVYDKNVGQYAQVNVEPQYLFTIRLTERILRQDDGDAQKEYNMNLQLLDLKTGLAFWQRRIPLRKLVDEKNIMN